MLLGVKDLFHQRTVQFAAVVLQHPISKAIQEAVTVCIEMILMFHLFFLATHQKKNSRNEQNIEQHSPIRHIVCTNDLLLTTPSKVTAKRPLFSQKTKRKHEHEPLTPRKIKLKKINKIVATRSETKEYKNK